MKQPRPVNLNLLTIRFPLPAIVSILHRMSGVFLFLLIPVMLWLLAMSLSSSGFYVLQQALGTVWVKLVCWMLLAPFCYHMVAGVRHLLMDAHLGVTLKASKLAAQLTFIIAALLILLTGIWLW